MAAYAAMHTHVPDAALGRSMIQFDKAPGLNVIAFLLIPLLLSFLVLGAAALRSTHLPNRLGWLLIAAPIWQTVLQGVAGQIWGNLLGFIPLWIGTTWLARASLHRTTAA